MPTSSTKKKIGIGRHRSKIKRQNQNEKKREANKDARSALRTVIKKVRAEPTAENLKAVTSKLARAGRKNLIHPKKASRLTSRLTKSVNRATA